MAYREIPVNVQTRQEGDAFARYRVRMNEMYESVRLCRVVLDKLPGGAISSRTPSPCARRAARLTSRWRVARASRAFT